MIDEPVHFLDIPDEDGYPDNYCWGCGDYLLPSDNSDRLCKPCQEENE